MPTVQEPNPRSAFERVRLTNALAFQQQHLVHPPWSVLPDDPEALPGSDTA